MRRRHGLLAVVAGVALAGAWLGGCRPQASTEPPRPRLLLAPIRSPAPFARALGVVPFHWPQDEGPHYAFQTEWWYYTGNLRTPDGAAFGYQLTIFRRGLEPGAPDPRGGLATNQIYLAHFALTDGRRGTHVAWERWSRGAAGLAGASAAPFRAFVEDWSAEAPDTQTSVVRLRAREGNDAIDLRAEPRKALVLHGDRGLSAKSSEPGNASYYVSSTRMAVRGTVTSSGSETSAAGEGWFDHEWSSSALGPRATGWDWFSLQLDDGREIMVFRIRQEDGTSDSASSATIVAASGTTTHLPAADVDLRQLGAWTSPTTHTRYPSGWTLRLPREDLVLDLRPLVADQEMRLSFPYWEGAVRIAGTARGKPASGRGYAELTGYAAPLRRLF